MKKSENNIWKAFGFAFLYLLLFVGIQAVVSIAGSLWTLYQVTAAEGMALMQDAERFFEVYAEAVAAQTSGIVLISNILSILVVWLIFACRKKKLTKELGLVKLNGKNLIGAVLLGVGLAFTVDFIIQLLPIPDAVMQSFVNSHDTLWQGEPIVNFLSVALLAPAAEELFFRGLIYRELKKAMRPLIAGGISAAVFGAVHGAAVWMLVGFLAGVALAWIYELTGSLWASVIVHLTNNTLAQITACFPTQTASVHHILIAISVVCLVFSVWLLHRNNPRPVVSLEN